MHTCEIDADEGSGLAGGRYVLGYEQHEHRVGEQDGDGEADLFAAVRRQPERAHVQDGQPHARHDYVEQVVEDAATHVNVHGHVRERLVRAARIVKINSNMLLCRISTECFKL